MGSFTAGIGGFIIGGIVVGGIAILAATFFFGLFSVTTGFGVAHGIANNTDAELIEQPDGDIIMYVPNASNTTGYQAVLIYENSSTPMQTTNMSPTTNKNTVSILTKTPSPMLYS